MRNQMISVEADFDTDSSDSVTVTISIPPGMLLMEAIKVIPDVVGVGATAFDAWLSGSTGVTKYDPSVAWLEEGRAVTAGTPSSPGRDPAEWAVWNDRTQTVWAHASAKASPGDTYRTHAVYVKIDFNGGTGHTGKILLLGEHHSTKKIIIPEA
jgi:hypothetical protein